MSNKYVISQKENSLYLTINADKIKTDSVTQFASDITDLLKKVSKEKKITIDLTEFKYSGNSDFYRTRADYLSLQIAPKNHNISIKLPKGFYDKYSKYQALKHHLKPKNDSYVLNFQF